MTSGSGYGDAGGKGSHMYSVYPSHGPKVVSSGMSVQSIVLDGVSGHSGLPKPELQGKAGTNQLGLPGSVTAQHTRTQHVSMQSFFHGLWPLRDQVIDWGRCEWLPHPPVRGALPLGVQLYLSGFF